jgi:glycosyltransferase involved in cell wall biosynthesis
MTLRVGIDARAYASPAAGVRRYVEGLTQALAAFAGDVELVRIESEGPALPTNLGHNASALPRAIARAKVDVFHAPAYTAPLWGSTPVVLSVHDVSYARHPEWYPYRRDPLRRWFYRRSAQRAAAIITISEFSRQEIEAAYAIPRDRIIVTPLGVGERFRPRTHAGIAADQAAATAVPPFLLHVGDLHVRRNLGIVVRALARLRVQAKDALARWPSDPNVVSATAVLANLKLVLAGVDRGLADALLDEATRAGVRDAIDIRGRVSEADLVTLYQRCEALVYPSRYEGFGFPLVEAMACGAPVIASNASAIPEVTGHAAVLVDPDDEAGFANAIAQVLMEPAHAADLRARGLARAAHFTWHETAARTLDAYRLAASARTGRTA